MANITLPSSYNGYVTPDALQKLGLTQASVPGYGTLYKDASGNYYSFNGSSFVTNTAAQQAATANPAIQPTQQATMSFSSSQPTYGPSYTTTQGDTARWYDGSSIPGGVPGYYVISGNTATTAPPPSQQFLAQAQAQQNGPNVTQNLTPGMQGPAVLELQKWLVQNGYLTQADLNTGPGVYGPKTKAAVAAWQNAVGVQTNGNPGYFGPNSRAYFTGTASNYSGVQNPTGPVPGVDPTNTTVGGVDISGLPPDQQLLLKQLQGFLDKLQANGQTINPNVQITPDQVAQFTAQAAQEIDPYYASQLKVATDAFLTNLGYSQQQIQQNEQLAQINYQQNLKAQDESYASQGFAQSGARTLDQQNLATSTQISLDQNRGQLQNQAYNQAAKFAQTYGSSALPATPTLSPAPRVLPGTGSFQNDGSSSPVYSLSPDIYNGLTGSNQYQRNVDVQNRTSQLESAFLGNQAIQQQRTLTL